MQAGCPNDLSQSPTVCLQGFDTIKSYLRSGAMSRLDKMATLCHLRRPITMNEARRFREVDRPARPNLQTRSRGTAELLFNGVSQILDQVEAVGHLPSFLRTSSGTLRIKTAAVTADDFDRRMLSQPAGGRIS